MVPHKKGCAGLYIINESNTLVLNGHSQKDFFTIPGLEKMVAETDSMDRRLITFRSTDFGGKQVPVSTAVVAAFVSVLVSFVVIVAILSELFACFGRFALSFFEH
jgi:hypothetical protein